MCESACDSQQLGAYDGQSLLLRSDRRVQRSRNACHRRNAYCPSCANLVPNGLVTDLGAAEFATARCMLLHSRRLALPAWKLAAADLRRACSRPDRLHSSTVGHTLCFAPIRASRQDVESIQQSKSKFPFADKFKLLNGEVYDSVQLIQRLDPLLTSQRRENVQKVCFVNAVASFREGCQRHRVRTVVKCNLLHCYRWSMAGPSVYSQSLKVRFDICHNSRSHGVNTTLAPWQKSKCVLLTVTTATVNRRFV